MPVFESTRKIQEFGSSLALTLPALFVKVHEVEKGSVVKVYYGLEGVLIVTWGDEPEALRKGLMEIINKLNKKVLEQNNMKGQNV